MEAPGARGVSRGQGLGTLPRLGAAPGAEEPGRLPVPGRRSCCAGVRDALGTRARLPVSGKLPVRRAVRGSWCPGNAPGVRGMLPVSGQLPVRRARGCSVPPSQRGARGAGQRGHSRGSPGAGSPCPRAPLPRSALPRGRRGADPSSCAAGAIPALPSVFPRAPGRRGAAQRPREPTRVCAHPQQTPPGCGSPFVPCNPTLCHPRIPPLCPHPSPAAVGGEPEPCWGRGGAAPLGRVCGRNPGAAAGSSSPSVVCFAARTRLRAGDTGLCWERSQTPGVCQGMFVCLDADLGRKAGSGVSSAAIHHRPLSFPFGIALSWAARLCQGNAAGGAMERAWPRASPPRHRAGARAALPVIPSPLDGALGYRRAFL